MVDAQRVKISLSLGIIASHNFSLTDNNGVKCQLTERNRRQFGDAVAVICSLEKSHAPGIGGKGEPFAIVEVTDSFQLCSSFRQDGDQSHTPPVNETHVATVGAESRRDVNINVCGNCTAPLQFAINCIPEL